MHIYWLGQGCFKLQSGETTVVIDPYPKDIGLKPPRTKADIVVMSDPSSNGIESVSGDYFLIKGPGEYEVKGIFVYGIGLDSVSEKTEIQSDKKDSQKNIVTIYRIEAEDMSVAHLDKLNKSLNNRELEKLENVDILMVPVGGGDVLDAKRAVEIINQVEPRIVIPMQYKLPGLKLKLDPVDNFLKVMHESKIKPVNKYIIKKKDLPQNRTEIIILEQT